MRILSILTMSLTLFAFPALAAECEPEFVDKSQTIVVSGIKIGLGEVSRENFSIRVRNDGTSPCSASVRFARLNGSAVSENLEYMLRSGSTSLSILPSEGSTGTSASDLFIPNLPKSNSGRNVPFILTVPSEWGIKSGFHSEQIQLNLIDPSGAVKDTMLLTINVNIPPAVSIRVVGATGSGEIARINLGDLNSTEISRSDPFGVRVWSTSPYLVTFRSENGGDLLHANGRDRIPYQLRMGQQLVNLGGSNQFTFSEHTSSLGEIHAMQAQAGPVTGVRAGHYDDRVTVTVTAV